MDEIRKTVRTRMEELGLSKRGLSLKLKKGATYMHDWLEGTSDLPYEVKIMLAELVDLDPQQLGVRTIAQPEKPHGGGLSEDAEAFIPPAGHYLAATTHVAFFRQKSNSLNQHQERIRIGDLLGFNLNLIDRAKIPTGSIVVAQLYDKHEGLKGYGTVIRQFIAPNKLITNSSDSNEIINMDDPALPYDVMIKGTLLSVIRESH